MAVLAASADEPALLRAYRRVLADADALDTPAGAQALHLAAFLATGLHTASGAASLSRELREAMATAMRGRAKPDAVDDLRARRERKVAGA